jgi:hypothetical protein
MTAVLTTMDDLLAWLPEPGWTREAFEQLDEDQAAEVLLRRLRKALARGFSDPVEALRLAARLDLPLA